MILEILVVGPLQTNCYLLGCEETREALVIDPGAEAGRIQEALGKHELKLTKVVLTHAHADHIGACGELKEATGAKILVHRDDAPLLADPHQNLTAYLGPGEIFPPADVLLSEGDTVEFGAGLRFSVLHTPGHTRGSICLLGDNLLFSGDTLFAGSVGRTDFPGGSFRELVISLRKRLLPLPDATKVYPGHGPTSTMEFEKQDNPYLTTEW
ncbi:MAG: MBL fold metallo-hydrolase [Candidatus Desulforudis sp.]|nr:MBL fold metallo-hydrolase [Desulforudis sp.]